MSANIARPRDAIVVIERRSDLRAYVCVCMCMSIRMCIRIRNGITTRRYNGRQSSLDGCRSIVKLPD